MKRPLAAVVLFFGAGIFLADRLSLALTGWLGAALAVAVLTLLSEPCRKWLLPLLLFLAGAANFSFHSSVISPHDLRVLVTNAPALVEVRGVLRETPSERIYQDGEELLSRTVAEVEVTALRQEGSEWRPAVGRVATSTPGILPPEFTRNSAVLLTGVLELPPLPIAEGLFDYRAYLQRRGVHYQLRCSAAADWTMESAAGLSWSDRFMVWAKANLMRGLPGEDEPLRLLWAMTLGWRTGLDGDVSEPFMRSGTMHVFAISGLHIALIALILATLLLACGVPRHYCAWIVIPLVWFYTAATGWQASAIRSTLMSSVVIAGWVFRRPSDPLNSLAGAALIILACDPQQLFHAGFLLSFAVVLSMILFEPVFRPFQKNWMQPDAFLPKKLHSRWMRFRQWAWMKAAPCAIGSTAAWLGSIPLVACFFHLFTPVTVVANLLVVPASSLALASSVASLMVGSFAPWLAAIFNHSSWFLMLCMVRLSEWFAGAPGAYFHVASPSAVTLVLYCGILVAILSGWFRRRALRRASVAIGIVLALIWLAQHATARAKTELTVLPLRASHAVYVTAPHIGGDWLIDCGSDTAARFVTRPFLAARGVNHIAHLALTHGDIQHVEGVELLDSSFAMGSTWVSPTRFRSTAYREASALLTNSNRRFASRGAALGPWAVLHPADDDRFAQADDSALVLRGSFNGVRVLLLSDLGQPGQEALLGRTGDLRADVVVAGFPRRGEPIVDRLIQAIEPKLVIIAETPEPMSEQRIAKVRARLGRRGVPALDARETGAITITIGRGQWVVSPMHPAVTPAALSSAPPRGEPGE